MKSLPWLLSNLRLSLFTLIIQVFLLVPIESKSQFSIVKDIGGSSSGNPGRFVKLNNEIYFSAMDNNGREFWKSDGTKEGTVMVKDIIAGPGSSEPFGLTVFNGSIYFFSKSLGGGFDLMKSDGTEGGTIEVKHFDGTNKLTFAHLTPVGDILYFRADDGIHGGELWKSNGTEFGTVMVKDILPGPGSGDPLFGIVDLNGEVFFNADEDNDLRYELWKSDGTGIGTTTIHDIDVGRYSVLNGFVYYLGFDQGTLSLWRTNGSFGGNQLIKNLNTNVNAGFLGIVGDRLMFLRTPSINSTTMELWVTDGTSNGTNSLMSYGGVDNRAALHSNQLFFQAGSGGQGEVWKTDGTREGTIRLASVRGSNFYSEGEYCYFNTFNSLWRSDGTPAGTILLSEGDFTSIGQIISINGLILFFGCISGDCELWKWEEMDPIDDPEEEVIVGLEEQMGFSFYPNPATEFLKIENYDSKIKSIRILDNVGRLVSTFNNVSNNIELFVGDLKAGSYTIRIDSQEHFKFYRLIKN